MKKSIVIGIDPGKSGCITGLLVEDNKVIFQKKIPLIGGKIVDTLGIDKMLRELDEQYKIKICILEDVHAVFGSAAGATFEFGRICGILEGLVVALKLPNQLVQPKAWQKVMWLGIPEIRKPNTKDKNGKERKGAVDTKAMSILAAKRLYPTVSLKRTERCTNDDDNIADSLLLASYGLKKVKSIN